MARSELLAALALGAYISAEIPFEETSQRRRGFRRGFGGYSFCRWRSR
jgi:hypothetical protein